MILVFDLGNSRLKWSHWQQGRMHRQGAVAANRAAIEALFDEHLASHGRPQAVYAVSVGDAALLAGLEAMVAKRWRRSLQRLRTGAVFEMPGGRLVHAYREPRQHGADRWAAMIAARMRYPQPLCVIGAGTAVTVDLIDASGRHLGGRILPSAFSMQQAVTTHAAQIAGMAPVDCDGAPALFPGQTEMAVVSGVYYAMQGAMALLVRQVCSVLPEDVRFVVSGGGGARLLHLSVLPDPVWREHLVMEGVYLAMHGRSHDGR